MVRDARQGPIAGLKSLGVGGKSPCDVEAIARMTGRVLADDVASQDVSTAEPLPSHCNPVRKNLLLRIRPFVGGLGVRLALVFRGSGLWFAGRGVSAVGHDSTPSKWGFDPVSYVDDRLSIYRL